MANRIHLAKLKEGVNAWNQWAMGHRELTDDFVGMRGQPISEEYVADLSGADLREVDLSHFNLGQTNLRSAILSAAKLNWSYLGYTNLRGANLSGACLHDANLTSAKVGGAILSAAKLSNTIFAAVDLSAVRGLESSKHDGPSVIDHRTLALSGLLPLSFLRGCGLPDQMIDYIPSLFNSAVQFYSCFISYSIKDQSFAERLHADLQNKGVRCWFAPQQMQAGRKLHEQIDEAIRVYEKLLLILSPSSMESEWVKTEIAKARRRELLDKRRMLFPIRLVGFEALRDWECFDADTGKDSAREVREYYIPDFSNWKSHDSYRTEFEKLMRDLKANEQKNIPT